MKPAQQLILIVVLLFVCESENKVNLWPQPRQLNDLNRTHIIKSQESLRLECAQTSISEQVNQLFNLYRDNILFFQTTNFFSPDFQEAYSDTENIKQNEGIFDQFISLFSFGSSFIKFQEHAMIKVLQVVINDTSQYPAALGTENEVYTLDTTDPFKWVLTGATYSGFARGMETFAQLVSYNQFKGHFEVDAVTIYDYPQFTYRGILVDTARHFHSKEVLLKTLDGMMYNKFNVLHWHITDAESFPFEMKSLPEITTYGMYAPGQFYSQADIKEIIAYAHVRGIIVMPEIDSPGHSTSWGFSPSLRNISMVCDELGNGQLDVSLDLTYQTLSAILQEFNEVFTDSLIHFGGDEVETWCWDQRPNIKAFMAVNNIATYEDLEVYYRMRLKSIWEKFSTTKDVVYWANADINLKADPNDIIEWWGSAADIYQLKDFPNRIILAPSETNYLDHFQLTWSDAYQFDPEVKYLKGSIYGGEACLWSEWNNDNTQDQKLWVRGSAIGERLWNPDARNTSTMQDLVRRISAMEYRLTARGLKPAPAVKEYCVKYYDRCYPKGEWYITDEKAL